MKFRNTMFPAISMYYESASVEVYGHGDGSATIRNLYSRKRSRGHATELLNQVLAFADKHGLVLYLVAKRYGDPRMGYGLDNRELIQFYERFGFVVAGAGRPMMRREAVLND